MISLILVNAKFFKNPEIQISHRAITKTGVIDYQFRISKKTNELIEKLNRTGLSRFTAQNLAYFFTREKFENHYYAKIDECGHLIGEDADNLSNCFPMKSGVFELAYRKLSAFSTAGFRE